MGTELPKTEDSSGDSDANNDSEHSSSSNSSGSEWECSDVKQGSAHKPHFSVTSCDTGLKLKIAAIPPRKVANKKNVKPFVKKKTIDNTPKTPKAVKDKPPIKKNHKSLLTTSSSSDSCSKCSSDSSSEDDLPLKTVSKLLQPKGSPLKSSAKTTPNIICKSDSDDKEELDCNTSKTNKDKNSIPKTSDPVVKKTKSDEVVNDVIVKRGRGRPKTKRVLPIDHKKIGNLQLLFMKT
ncbi:unnamed protein product [Diatraea saccharalis]|uniref:Uncharacterized protein n=1 Tax=Diatraea saccharalis TaxID=40085 RepID=A0A9N9WGL5_9NEOP|nr:unnamed protein product [Diatraea saccharalis]